MLLERSELMIREGQEEGFDAVMRERGLSILSDFDGVNAVHFGRGVENPSKFLLMVEWVDMSAHEAFKKSPVYGPFRELFGPYSVGGVMEHFEMI